MSRNGSRRRRAPIRTRTIPRFCTTYSRPGSLRGAPIHQAPRRPEANGRKRSPSRSAFAAASGTATAQAASSAAAIFTPQTVARLAREPVDRPVAERRRVDLARRVLAERGEARDLEPLPARAGAELPDRALAVVAVDVAAIEGRNRPTPVDVPARDRAAPRVAVDRDREDEHPAPVHLLAGRVARAALPDAPAVVVERPLLPRRAHVDLLPLALADVADVEIAGLAVPREAPRVPQPVAGDLPARPGLVDVEAQQLAEARAQGLRVVVRVAAATAVAGAGVQAAVGPELQLPAVVVAELAVVDAEQRLGRRGQADGAVGAELVDAHVSGVVVEVDEEAMVPRVPRVERDRQQPLLASAADPAADVEERLRAQPPVHHDADHARLLDDVQLPRFAARLRHVDRRVEAGDERAQAQLLALLLGRRGALAAGGARQRHRDDRGDDPERSHQLLSKTLRSSSSLPGCRIASTWSPAWSSVEPTAISERPLRMIEIRREPSGRSSFSTVLPAAGAPLSIWTSTISRFSLRSSSRCTRSCSGTSCSTRPRTLDVA